MPKLVLAKMTVKTQQLTQEYVRSVMTRRLIVSFFLVDMPEPVKSVPHE